MKTLLSCLAFILFDAMGCGPSAFSTVEEATKDINSYCPTEYKGWMWDSIYFDEKTHEYVCEISPVTDTTIILVDSVIMPIDSLVISIESYSNLLENFVCENTSFLTSKKFMKMEGNHKARYELKEEGKETKIIKDNPF